KEPAMRTLQRLSVPSLLAALLVVVGCNVLDPVYDEEGSVQTLLENARYARANGDFDRAAELLEAAYAQEPENAEVRLELAGTLLQREDLNSIDLVGQVTDFMRRSLDGEAGHRGGSADSCSWEGSEPTRPFDPGAFPEYGEILAARPVLNQVRDLLAGPDGAFLPPALVALRPCDVVMDGEAVYDRDEILADLYATFGNDPNRVRTALMLNAVTLTLNGYANVFEQPDVPVSWFLVGEQEDAHLGFCIATEEVVTFQERITEEVNNVSRAMSSLDLLVHDASNAALAALRDEALGLYEVFEADLGLACG